MTGARRGAPSGRHSIYAAILFALLLAASIAAFASTRALRAQPDFVSAVRMTSEILPGEAARVRFTLAEPDRSTDVMIVDRRGRQVRALDRGASLGDGRHGYRWDGRDEAGQPARPGRYGLRVVLGEADRDIRPPGEIRVRGAPRLGWGR